MTESTNHQVDFYVLNFGAQSDKERYACRLVNRAFVAGYKIYVQTDDIARADALDKTLWTFSQSSFVPHVLYRGEAHDAVRYPVQIGAMDGPDNCNLLVSLRSELPGNCEQFARIAELVGNSDAERTAGRVRYREYVARGITPKHLPIDEKRGAR